MERAHDGVRDSLRLPAAPRDLPDPLRGCPDLARAVGRGGGRAGARGSRVRPVRPASQGEPIVRLAELRRRQGHFAAAAELLAQVEGTRCRRALAALALDNGDTGRARDLAERSLRQTPITFRAERALALELLVTVEVALGDVEAGERALEELRSIAALAPTEPLQARASRAGGQSLRPAERSKRRVSSLEDAVDLFGRCSAPYESAWARLDLARVLGECGRPSAAREEAATAREAFERLVAQHGVERASRLLADLEDGVAAAPPPAGDLTTRELEVLRLLAAGLTNRQLAARLVISEHTVHRHVTNLYRKLGVSSRAAAATYAHRQGLA